MKILDATCGTKQIWYQKNHPLVTFMDKRKGTFYFVDKKGKKYCWKVNPDVVSEWKDAPFPDNYFDMIVFDPPHIIQNAKSNITTEYGKLNPNNWTNDLRIGIKKLFEVLKPNGFFILKWCENDKKIERILSLIPYRPLFGTRTGHANKNHWICFIKYEVDKKIIN